LRDRVVKTCDESAARNTAATVAAALWERTEEIR